MKKLYLMLTVLVIFGVFIMGVAEAQPPFVQEADFTNALFIRVNEQQDIVNNQPYDLYVSAYNYTGLELDNTTTDCALHFFNSTGQVIRYQFFDYDATFSHFYMNFTGTELSSSGIYNWLIACNTSLRGGFVEGFVEISTSGSDLDEGTSIFLALIIVLFMILSITMFFSFQKQGKWQLKVTYLFLSYTFFLVVLNMVNLIAVDYIVSSSLISFFDSITAIAYIIFWFGAVFIFVIWIITLFQALLLRKARIKTQKFW